MATDYGSRLQKARKAKGLTQVQLSKLTGIPQSTISTAETDGQGSAETAVFAEALDVHPVWLATGKGEMRSTEASYLAAAEQRHALGGPSRSSPDGSAHDDLVIPQYKAGGAMGLGLILDGIQPGIIRSWSVTPQWVQSNIPSHTGITNLCIVTGFGDSMRGDYNAGDPLVVDRGVTTCDHEGIYFFRVGNHGYIKRLQRIPLRAGGIVIKAKSSNANYETFEIFEDMDFEIFAKVLKVWKSENF